MRAAGRARRLEVEARVAATPPAGPRRGAGTRARPVPPRASSVHEIRVDHPGGRRAGVALVLALASGLLGTQILAPAHADGFRACLAELRGEALGRGIPGPHFDRHTRDLDPDPSVLERLDYQPEFRTPVWDYLAGLVDEERVADGRVALAQWSDTLAAVEARFGVAPETVVAIWGVESDYGRLFGRRAVLRSLATLSCEGRRQSFFRGELFATLEILHEGHFAAGDLVGSWAGAFGHTQFMPSTFRRVAVDFDGDGRADLLGSVPDALASTANYLKLSGWRSDRPWGFEVLVPAGLDPGLAGRRDKRPLSEWAARGLVRADGVPLETSATPAGLLLPAGVEGPAFLVLRNFDALYSYNAAETYALAIGHLADRVRGQGGFGTPWPTDDPGLSRAERRELQTLLLARGHDIGEVDGLIGPVTRAAIGAEQRRLGHPPDGRAGRRILEALRDG